MSADLHLHTNQSDGQYTHQELCQLLHDADADSVFSVADHHTFTLMNEMVDAHGHRWIPGIEISASIDDRAIHLLGYSLSPRPTAELRTWLQRIVAGYQKRSTAIHAKIVAAGFSMPPLEELRPVTLPLPIYNYDLASALASSLQLSSPREALKYAKEHGDLFFVDEGGFLPEVSDMIRMMNESNLLVVFAHPGTRYLLDDSAESTTTFLSMISTMTDAGLGGLEVYYPQHSDIQKERFLTVAREWNLIPTGGSDFHGPGRGISNPSQELPDTQLQRLLQALPR